MGSSIRLLTYVYGSTFGMCDVFLSATDPGVSNQTNFTFDRVSFKSILGHASILQTECCSQNVQGNPKPDENATAPQNLFWNLCGQGKGAGREVEAWSSVYIEILLAFTQNHPNSTFHCTPHPEFHLRSPNGYFGKGNYISKTRPFLTDIALAFRFQPDTIPNFGPRLGPENHH